MSKKKKYKSAKRYVFKPSGVISKILDEIYATIRKMGYPVSTLSGITINGFTKEKYYVKTKEDADRLVKALEEIANIPKYIPVKEITAVEYEENRSILSICGDFFVNRFVDERCANIATQDSFYEVRVSYSALSERKDEILHNEGSNPSFVSSISARTISFSRPIYNMENAELDIDGFSKESEVSCGSPETTQDEIKHVSSACEGMYMDND